MRKKSNLVCGVGVNDSECPVYVDGKHITSYDCWRQMLNRCYSTKQQTKQPTYVGCTVTPEWLSFSTFRKWYDANYVKGMHLDKDVLVEGNKIYSPVTCRIVPRYVNNLLNDHGNGRGNLPLGITLTTSIIKGRIYQYYNSQCSNGSSRLCKKFKTLEEAVQWYSETKTRVVREVAQNALDAGEILQDVFDALIARKF